MCVQVSDRACVKCIALEVVRRWVEDAHGYRTLRSWVECVLCNLCENGHKGKVIRVVLCAEGGFL